MSALRRSPSLFDPPRIDREDHRPAEHDRQRLGEKQAGALEIQILEDGAYKDLGDISNQLLISSSGKQYRLGDIARVERGYADPPQTLMRVNGRRAMGIGISTEADVDVVKAGEKIGRVLGGLRQMPVGMDLTVLSAEDRIAREANSTFILNLAESVAIVILIIMLVMGFRAGVLIGGSAAVLHRRYASADAVSGRRSQPHLAGGVHHRDGHAGGQRHRGDRQCAAGHAAGRRAGGRPSSTGPMLRAGACWERR